MSLSHRTATSPDRRTVRARCAALAVAMLLSGCAYVPSAPDWFSDFSWAYKVDVQQGMVVTQEMSAELRPGLSRDQVKFVLGTPLLQDPLHASRWDYVFRYQPGRGPIEERRFTVFFKDDKLDHTQGDPLPTEAQFVANRIELARQQRRFVRGADTTIDYSQQDPSIWERIRTWLGFSGDESTASGPAGAPATAPSGGPGPSGPSGS